MTFKTELGETIFKQKYASNPYETWEDKAHSVVNSVCGDFNGMKTPLMVLVLIYLGLGRLVDNSSEQEA